MRRSPRSTGVSMGCHRSPLSLQAIHVGVRNGVLESIRHRRPTRSPHAPPALICPRVTFLQMCMCFLFTRQFSGCIDASVFSSARALSLARTHLPSCSCAWAGTRHMAHQPWCVCVASADRRVALGTPTTVLHTRGVAVIGRRHRAVRSAVYHQGMLWP